MVSTADSHISQYNVHGSMLAANHQYVHGSTARYPGTIENVQKFALRVCSKSWSSDYATLLDTLSIPTLSDRRDTLKLCLLFNILTDRVTYPSCPTMLKHTPYANQHTNTVQLVVPELTQTSLNTCSSHPRLRDGMVYTSMQMALLH